MRGKHLKMRGKNTRDKNSLWLVIRELKTFTRQDVAARTDHHYTSVGTFLAPLIKAGYVKELNTPAQDGRDKRRYKLVRDAGLVCPQLDKDGKALPPSERQRMWSALKVVGGGPFDWRDLSFIAKVKGTVAQEYCLFLHRGGYLRQVKPSTSGVAGSPAQYHFVRSMDSGQLAPEIRQRKTELYDVNKRKVVWKKGGVA